MIYLCDNDIDRLKEVTKPPGLRQLERRLLRVNPVGEQKQYCIRVLSNFLSPRSRVSAGCALSSQS
jgi:hypothetical protein